MKDNLHFTIQDLEKLMNWKSDIGILSLYLDTEERDMSSAQKFQGVARSLIHSITEKHSQNEVLKNIAGVALEDLHELPKDMRRRSLVYFKDAATGDVYMKSLQTPVKPLIRWMGVPYLRPMVALLDESPIIGIVIMARDEIKMMTYQQGIIDEENQLKIPIIIESYHNEVLQVGRPVGKRSYPARLAMPSEGYSRNTMSRQDMFDKHESAVLQRNMSDYAKQLDKYAEKYHWQNIILIGSTKLTDILEDEMFVRWREMVIGKLEKDFINTPIDKIAESTSELLGQWKRKLEEQLVRTIVNLEASNGRAVIGAQKTIDALAQNRLERLVFNTDLQLEGYVDSAGNYFAGESGTSPEGNLTKENHIIECLIRKAFEVNTRITPLEGTAADLFLPYGGIGGILRYSI